MADPAFQIVLLLRLLQHSRIPHDFSACALQVPGVLKSRGAQVDAVTARVGRRGHVHFRGAMPLQPQQEAAQPAPGTAAAPAASSQQQPSLGLDLQNLEVRVRNVYTGIRLKTSRRPDSNLVPSTHKLQPSRMPPEAVSRCCCDCISAEMHRACQVHASQRAQRCDCKILQKMLSIMGVTAKSICARMGKAAYCSRVWFTSLRILD